MFYVFENDQTIGVDKKEKIKKKERKKVKIF